MWSGFETSPLEDETICNSFSSRGMFTIRNEELVEQHPSVQACVQNNQMVISIDRSLVLVEEQMETKCSFLNFCSSVDVFAISSKTGNLIVLGLSNGEIHGMFIRGMPLFNVCIDKEDVQAAGKTFVLIQEIDEIFYAVCTNGSIYRLSKIDENPLSILGLSANGNETVAFDESQFDSISLKKLSAMQGKSYIDTAILMNQTSFGSIDGFEDSKSYLLIAGSNRFIFLQYQLNGPLIRLRISESYGGVKRIFNLDNYIVALTHSGHLLKICPITKNIFFESSSNPILIDDIIIMELNDENIELLVLSKEGEDTTEEQNRMRLIKFIQYPSRHCINEFDVPKCSWIVQQPKSAVNLYYLKAKKFNQSNFPTEIEMMGVSETHPSERFKKLIAKGRLEEAEDYGKNFELCLQPIYEAKAKHILIQLCNLDENNPEILNEHFVELKKYMELIENSEFFHKNRMINLPSRKLTEFYLDDLLKRLNAEEDAVHILEIREQLRRLETLRFIDRYECDSEWQKFVYSANLVKYLSSRLKTDIAVACVIWKRHSAAIIPYLNERDIQQFLTLIPDNTELFNVIQWLRLYIPIVCNTHPETMTYITDWSIQKTRSLQYSEHWPAIGLEFSTKILEIVEEIDFMHFHVLRQREKNIVKLRQLVNALQDLAVLKNSYNLIFTLDSYQQESLDKTAFCILQRAHLSNLKSIVNDFLNPIFQERGESPVNAIRKYINELVALRMAISTWLGRAVACIELLHDEDDKLESALAVLQCAPVPWPEILSPLVKLRYSTHPLASKINNEFEVQAIKVMIVKYGWPADTATNINFDLLMMRIVKLDFPEMLDDLHTLIIAAPEIATSAYFNCCYQLARRGKPNIAYEFFKSLGLNKRNINCIENIFEIFADLLETAELSYEEQIIKEHTQLIEFFKLITPKECESSQKRLRYIESRFTLFQRFKVYTKTAYELVSYRNRLKFLQIGVKNIIVAIQANQNSQKNLTKYIQAEIFLLTAALQMHKIQGVQLTCHELKSLSLACSLAYAVLESADCNAGNRHLFIDLALDLLAQQMLMDTYNQRIPEKSLTYENDPLVFPLVYELLVRANLHESCQSIELIELIQYINICNLSYPLNAIHNYYLGHDDEINQIILNNLNEELNDSENNCSRNPNGCIVQLEYKSEKKRDSVSVFDEIEVQPQTNNFASNETLIVNFVSRTLLVLLIKVEPTNGFFLQLRNLVLSQKFDLNEEHTSKMFFLSLEQMIKIQAHNIWYTVTQYVLEYEQRHGLNDIIVARDFVTFQLHRVFRKLLSQNNCNFNDIFAIVKTDHHTAILFERLEQDLKTDQQKFNFLTLKQMYYDFLGEKENGKAIHIKRLKHYYYMEFCKQDPTIKGKFNIEFESIDKLLKEFRNKQLDVNLLQRISEDFDLNLEFMLTQQVLSILQSQEMKYEVKIDSFGEEELVMITTVEYLRSLCQPYIDKISNAESLTAKLKQFIDEINIYFYELYLCVIEILSFIDTAPKEMHIWTSILHFLKHKLIKRRQNRPGQLETDLWFQSQSDIGVLPKIARYRIPFKPIVEEPLKNILDNELSIENCESWFPLIDMHAMLKGSKESGRLRDYFCMAAVKNCITDYKAKTNSKTWHMQPTNNAFLKSILRLVQRIESPSNVFLLLYFVSNYAPDGADQVEASYECFQYALTHEQQISDPKCREQLRKIKRKYPILKTQHLLYVHGLTDEKLLSMVENPIEIIYNLYHHELIVKPRNLDINMVIKEIAKLHNINLETIHYKLLNKWLSIDCQDGTVLEETFLEDHNLSHKNVESMENAAENVVRANYILKSWPKEDAVQFLVAHIFPIDESLPNTSKQLQMLECLSKFNDGSVSLDNMLSQRQYITAKCVNDLKRLGYNSSTKKFEKCNKIDILKTIWQRNAQDPYTLEVLANICLGYDIYLERIWNGILKRMVYFNMNRELNALVDVLSCQPQLLHVDGLVSAWEHVLKIPFRNSSRTRSLEEEETMLKALFRLQSCPVLEKLNLFDFAQLSINLDSLRVAAVLMTLTKEDLQRERIKKLILPHKTEKLGSDILSLEDAGILPSILHYAVKELEL